jgi:hypothetical protein
VHRQRRDIAIVEQDLAVLAGHQADDHVEGRGLAGAVRAQQPDDLAALDLERQIRTTWRDL